MHQLRGELMSQNMMVSVICNTYNHGPYVRDALEGFVMQQTSFPFEVLVHDDASTDNTADIIREYEAKYPEIIKPIYQTENQYSQKVRIDRTFQIPRITGKYVAVCEGDDYWTDPMKLQKQVDFLESHPDYSLCACSTVWQNLKTGITEETGKIPQDTDISLEELIVGTKGRFFQYATILMRAEIFTERPAWMYPFPIGDYPLTIHAALRGKVRMLSDTMCVYRYYAANSWTVRMDNDEKRAAVSRRMIEGLEALDEATAGAHHDVIARRILRHKYTLALMTHDYAALRSGELGKLYRSRSLLRRTSDLLRCKFPHVYATLCKPLARIIKSKYGD